MAICGVKDLDIFLLERAKIQFVKRPKNGLFGPQTFFMFFMQFSDISGLFYFYFDITCVYTEESICSYVYKNIHYWKKIVSHLNTHWEHNFETNLL